MEASRIEEVCEMLWDRPGKKVRPQLVAWFSAPYGVPQAHASLYMWAVEAVHTATLLHDDVIDQAELRRGAASANHVYGNTLAVLGGDYLIGEVVDRLSREGDPRILRLMCRALKELCQGEVIQHNIRYTIPPDPRIFREIAVLKTASLFRWAMKVGPLLSDSSDLAQVDLLAVRLGVLFQMCDDWGDVFGAEGKVGWNDLREGRLNSVTWGMVAESDSLRASVEKAFAIRSVTPALAAEFACSLSHSKSIERSRKEILNLAETVFRGTESLTLRSVRSDLGRLIEGILQAARIPRSRVI